ncbi:hypothetical protein HY492_03240 [Candidatus Woesearchaeota archaeon]|nr:hypothetical protein [Candidatus Woesearchaeota archaeon]
MKRKSLHVQRVIYEVIKKVPGITMSQLERKIGTNPRSLKEHCESLAYFKLIKIVKKPGTQQLYPI